LIEKGISVNIDTLLRDLHERDTRDAARSSAPLATAPDAVTIDTSDMGIEEVVSRILALANGAVPSLKDISVDAARQ
jgi:cytidylate kinase